MDLIIKFFRDFLSGPLYIGVSIDETIMNFLKSIPEMKQKIEGEDADE